jgi:ABC-type dipeptide/oligopeptide/nickel transport system permease component
MCYLIVSLIGAGLNVLLFGNAAVGKFFLAAGVGACLYNAVNQHNTKRKRLK